MTEPINWEYANRQAGNLLGAMLVLVAVAGAGAGISWLMSPAEPHLP